MMISQIKRRLILFYRILLVVILTASMLFNCSKNSTEGNESGNVNPNGSWVGSTSRGLPIEISITNNSVSYVAYAYINNRGKSGNFFFHSHTIDLIRNPEVDGGFSLFAKKYSYTSGSLKGTIHFSLTGSFSGNKVSGNILCSFRISGAIIWLANTGYTATKQYGY